MALMDDRGTSIDSYITNLLAGKASTGPASVLLQGSGGGGTGGSALDDIITNALASLAGLQEQSMIDDRAAEAFSQEMARQQLALDREKMDLARRGQEFDERDTTTKRMLEAAGLATGPTGAIQLAYLARGQGAPNDQIKGIFQNLPFVKALLAGQALPGFGVPEQLGGPSDRVSSTTGGLFGTVLPGLNSITERQMSGMSASEKHFLGALYQAEFGIPVEDSLQTISNSFLPTSNVQPLSIGGR